MKCADPTCAWRVKYTLRTDNDIWGFYLSPDSDVRHSDTCMLVEITAVSLSPGRGPTGVYFNFRFLVCLQLTKKVFKTQADKPKKRENLRMKRQNSKS